MPKGRVKRGKPPWTEGLKRMYREERAAKQYKKTVLKLLVKIIKLLEEKT